MAHKLYPNELLEEKKTRKHWFFSRIAGIEGKFGVSFYIGRKEIFVGITVGSVQLERIIKKRFVPLTKASVKVYKFDSV